MELQYASSILAEVCSKMSSDLISNTSSVLEVEEVNGETTHSEWKHRLSVLEQDFSSREEMRNAEIEKLKSENSWLQNRLSERLQQTRHQNDIIDELKRDLIESVQQTEISEGRRSCYEHKIKILEEQLDKLTMSRIPETDMFEQGSEESLAKQKELIDLNSTLKQLHKKQTDQEMTYQEEIAKLHLELQYYRQSVDCQEAHKIVQIQNELVQKKKEVALLQDLVEDQYCQIQTLHKKLGQEGALNASRLKQLLGRDAECSQDDCVR
ncbi:hypothetical protein [Chlamydia vaughanii]|uniref:hypothetical protein n=1 Tax=Chlamydia vaughanii TaxID=3112552 RepID=UPI0032B1ED10